MEASEDGRREEVCACRELVLRLGLDEDEVAVQVSVFDEQFMAPIDTATLSIWIDHAWFIENGGRLTSKGGSANAADGREIGVIGSGKLKFAFWGVKFEEEVRVMSMLPDKMLIGRRFWRANGLQLDLGKNSGSVRQKNRHVHGPIGSRGGEDSENMSESVRAVIEDADVDQVLKTMDFSAF